MSEFGRHYTTNIQKGGALIPECRNLLHEFSLGETIEQFTDRVISENLLGKMPRPRVRDIVNRVFKRRFDSERTPGICARRLFEAGLPPEVTDRILYYHATLADDLLYDFVVEFLFQKRVEPGCQVTIGETEEFLADLQRAGRLQRGWTTMVRTKVGRGLLAAARDFHLLEEGL